MILLANYKWSDTGLNKRLNIIEYLVKQLRQSDTLATDDWKKIINLAVDLKSYANELEGC